MWDTKLKTRSILERAGQVNNHKPGFKNRLMFQGTILYNKVLYPSSS